MKKLSYLVAAVAMFCCVACSSGPKDGMTPVATKINGPLGDYFEVVSRGYVVNDDEVRIELRRIAAGLPDPWQPGMEVGYNDGQVEPLFTIEYQDADGNVLAKEKLSIVWDEDELKEVVALGVGETATVTFDCEVKASQFKVGSTFEVNEPSYSSSSSRSSYDDDEEDDDDDDSYGDFETELNNAIDEFGNELTDAFNSAFGLGGSNNSNNNSNNSGSSSASSGSSSDWDALLDSYESYVDKYVAVMQKVSKGDLTALAESTSLLNEAQELDKKLAGAKGSMSAAQTSRYMKIMQKMTNTASQLVGM